MAKISANGATKVAEIRAHLHDHPQFGYVFVMCSDGRILRRNDESGSGFNVWTSVAKDQATHATLTEIVGRRYVIS